MAKYSDEFKVYTVGLLKDLNKKGKIVLGSVEIKNVRMLVRELGISSYSLYKWNDELFSSKRMVCDKEDFCKTYQSDDDEGYGNCNMMGNCDDFKEVVDRHEDILSESLLKIEEPIEKDHCENGIIIEQKPSIKPDLKTIGKLEIEQAKDVKKDVFGLRFYGWFAKNLGIKNYGILSLSQLKNLIGLELIDQGEN